MTKHCFFAATAAGTVAQAPTATGKPAAPSLKPLKEGQRQLPARPQAPVPLERSGSSAAVWSVTSAAAAVAPGVAAANQQRSLSLPRKAAAAAAAAVAVNNNGLLGHFRPGKCIAFQFVFPILLFFTERCSNTMESIFRRIASQCIVFPPNKNQILKSNRWRSSS